MNKESAPPHMQLAIMSREYVVSRAIHAIAHLGIADHMSEQPVPVRELAELTGTHPDLLDRVLSFLTLYGLFIKKGETYALTPLSAPLREDHPDSIKEVLSMVDESWWQAFAQLETTLKTGTPAFNIQHGCDFFNFLKRNPDKKIQFQRGISKLSTFDDQTIAQDYHFGAFKRLMDIGSGQEGLSQAIIKQHPSVSINSFNFSAVNTPSAHSFFSSLPAADGYIFKGMLHDFNDEKIGIILKDLHQHSPKHASLIIAEQVIPENNLPHTNKTMDIIMMVLVGGRQRTPTGWRDLIEKTGFKLINTYPTRGIYTIMEFGKA